MFRNSIISTILFILITVSVSADIPKMINYQGKVTDTAGNPVPDGSYLMQFKIFDAPTGNVLLWSSGDVSVDVADGTFSVLLGQSPQPSLDLAFDQDCWLEVVVEGVVQSPRQQLISVGYAYMASGLIPGTEISGEVTTPDGAVIKALNMATSGSAYGLWGESASTSGEGVHGYGHIGVYGRTVATNGFGVYARADATTGLSYGVYAQSQGDEGRGVYGIAWRGGPSYGVFGENRSSEGTGVYGWATATTGTAYGVHGHSDSRDGSGVYGTAEETGVVGYAFASTGETYGVFGENFSDDGSGIYGRASSTTGSTRGVYGESISNLGRGVFGNCPNGTGVYGIATGTIGSNKGVYGTTYSTDGIGVYYSGGLAGSGAKSCIVKTSQGPTLMYCQESPENWFEDFGEGQLVNGRCYIELDPLFLETVTIDAANPMKVYVTPNGPLGEWWVEKGNNYFSLVTMNAVDGTRFDYRIVAKRKGFESKRLDYCTVAETDSYLYPELREKELQELETRRLGNVRD